MIGLTTLVLHILATGIHTLSALLLMLHASDVDLLVVNEWTTAGFHLVGALIWSAWLCRGGSESEYKPYESTRRWVEYAITAGLVEVVLADSASSGWIAIIVVFNVALQMLGWLGDQERNATLVPYGFLVLALQVLLVALNTTKPWYTVAIFAAYYALFGATQWASKEDRLLIDEDHAYTLLSIATKITLTWTVVAQAWGDGGLELAVNLGALGFLLAGGFLVYWLRDDDSAAPALDASLLLSDRVVGDVAGVREQRLEILPRKLNAGLGLQRENVAPYVYRF